MAIGDRNRILAALPDAVSGLHDRAEEVTLRRGDVIVESHGEIGHGTVYLPHSGIISLVVVMPDGAAVEAAVVGREGIVGHPYLADFEAAPARATVQLEGRATQLAAEDLSKVVAANAAVREVFGRFARAFLAQTLQTVACNALHQLEERLAKWLLQSADRTVDNLSVTHEFLGEMLGASRPSVTLACRSMQAARLIRYRRAQIEIADRNGLEELSCPCYAVIRKAYQQLLPLTFG